MTRTDELRQQGATEIGGGGSHPFVAWPDGYSWVEGRVRSIWEGKYGKNATMEVTAHSQGLQARMGSDEPMVPVEEGQTVNVSLNYAALEGVGEAQIGHEVHVAFEGWEKSKAGNRYRVWTALDLTDEDAPTADEAPDLYERTGAPQGGGPGAPGAEGPPVDDYESEGSLPF